MDFFTFSKVRLMSYQVCQLGVRTFLQLSLSGYHSFIRCSINTQPHPAPNTITQSLTLLLQQNSSPEFTTLLYNTRNMNHSVLKRHENLHIFIRTSNFFKRLRQVTKIAIVIIYQAGISHIANSNTIQRRVYTVWGIMRVFIIFVFTLISTWLF